MSHNIEYFTYPRNVNKARVKKDLDNFVAHADWQEGASGLCHPIRWIEDKVYSSEEEARSAIHSMDNKWYDQIAVLFQNSNDPNDEKIRELRKKSIEARDEYQKRDRVLYAEKVTSAFIGCKNCGSKLARTFLHSNSCPVCHVELRPEHMMKSISSAKNKWLRTQREVEEYIQKKGKKDVMWLVKIEYHT